MKKAARAATAAAAAGLLAFAAWSAFHGPGGTGRFAARAAGTSTATTFQWQYAATGVDRVPDAVLRGSSSIQIAIIDTGADVSAPDLAARHPVTYDLQTRKADVADANGHGTFVASLAASIGDAKLLVIKAGRADGSFTSYDEARAIRYAVDRGARIVNLSLSGTTTSPVEKSAIAYAVKRGVLLVAAVGNEYKQGNPVEYPAALLQPLGSNGLNGSGLAVAASTRDGVRASFSNTGSWVSLAGHGRTLRLRERHVVRRAPGRRGGGDRLEREPVARGAGRRTHPQGDRLGPRDVDARARLRRHRRRGRGRAGALALAQSTRSIDAPSARRRSSIRS